MSESFNQMITGMLQNMNLPVGKLLASEAPVQLHRALADTYAKVVASVLSVNAEHLDTSQRLEAIIETLGWKVTVIERKEGLKTVTNENDGMVQGFTPDTWEATIVQTVGPDALQDTYTTTQSPTITSALTAACGYAYHQAMTLKETENDD